MKAYSCRVCGHGIMAAVACRLHGGPVHETHCRGCRYHDRITNHCLYYQKEIAPAKLAAELEAEKQRRIDEALAKERAIIEKHSAMIRDWQERHRTK